jgi:hypothetical protein
LCSPMPSRWWSGEGFKAEEDFFNKQPLLWRGDGLRQLLLPLAMVARIEAGTYCGYATMEKVKGILLHLSSTTRMASSPLRFSAKKTASTQPPVRRPLGPVVGARRILAAKWFVPGGLETTNGCSSSPKGSQRAPCSCSSAATPGGRRRAVAATPRDLIA